MLNISLKNQVSSMIIILVNLTPHIIRQVVSLKELIHVVSSYIKYQSVMMTIKSRGFYFVRAHDLLIKVIVFIVI
jgi:hypothetical protein